MILYFHCLIWHQRGRGSRFTSQGCAGSGRNVPSVWETCASSHASCPHHQRRLLTVWNQMTGLLLLLTVIALAWGLTPDPVARLPLAALGHVCPRVPRPRLRPMTLREQAGGLTSVAHLCLDWHHLSRQVASA